MQAISQTPPLPPLHQTQISLKSLSQISPLSPLHQPHLQTPPPKFQTPHTHVPLHSHSHTPPCNNKTPTPLQKQAPHPHTLLHKPHYHQQLNQTPPRHQTPQSHLSPPRNPTQPYTHSPASRVPQKSHIGKRMGDFSTDPAPHWKSSGIHSRDINAQGLNGTGIQPTALVEAIIG
ncbi:pleckstrin homology-like domain family A member 1 [Sinocyclocheilus grahami]|uniref:pleckstrin homology-like domain family A member 1 n=1 Tax=Sinocyclocheilus grahami TaxID=75366 RepID=UPI0007ACAD3D|nr:PREDICTED: pleckstrin homology-like domain family A member 1 [Sinocyclocheilus grahami]